MDSSCEEKLPNLRLIRFPMHKIVRRGIFAGCLAERLRLRPALVPVPLRWWSCHPSAGCRAAAGVGHPDLRDP